jgi:hypothetical protein
MVNDVVLNTKGLTVQGVTGPKHFAGIHRTWHETVVTIKLADGRTLTCSPRHKIMIGDDWQNAEEVKVGDSLLNADLTDVSVSAVETKNEPQWLYDLIDVDGGNAYITNGIVSHNCEFLSSDALLVDSRRLNELRPSTPIREDNGVKFWKEIDTSKTYLFGIDPATGSNSDFTTFEIFELETLEQVAELRLNTVSVPLIYAKIKWMLNVLTTPDANRRRANVVWSFERNGVGEALIAMIQNDDVGDGVYLENTELYNDSNKDGRLGVYTTGKSKLLNCMQMKNLIEKVSNGMILHSSALVEELKNFVAKGGSYSAKNGSTDDLVSACLVVTKLLERVAQWDENARQAMYEQVDPYMQDSFGAEPLPYVF